MVIHYLFFKFRWLMLHKSSHNLSISQYLTYSLKVISNNQNLNYSDTYIGLQFKIWKSNFILSRFVLHFSTGNKQIVCSDSLCWVDFVILTNGGKLMQKQPTCYCFLNVTGVIYHKAEPKMAKHCQTKVKWVSILY